MRRLALLLAIALGVAVGVPAVIPVVAAFAQAPQLTAADIEAWQKEAGRIETELGDGDSTTESLENDRRSVAAWRERFIAANAHDNPRVTALNAQIEALGPAPAEGATEAPEIADRRAELLAEKSQLEAPKVAANEALSRAEVLISEIDRSLRDRQAAALLELWPAPVNPANWPDAFASVQSEGAEISNEFEQRLASPTRYVQFRGNLPLILLELAVAVFVLVRGRRWMERLTEKLAASSSPAVRRVWWQVVSVGQVILPVAGISLLSLALYQSGLVGPRAIQTVVTLPWAGLAFFIALWLANVHYPKGERRSALNMPREARAEARFHLNVLGLLTAIVILLAPEMEHINDAAKALIQFPAVAIGGVTLFRFGQLLRRQAAAVARTATEEPDQVRPSGLSPLRYLALGLMLIGVLGPILAGVGYVVAGRSMVFGGVMTLWLFAFVIFLQNLFAEVYTAVTKGDDSARDALVPVLISFLLWAMALPVLALIWGARASDLAEVWLRFQQGYSVGGIQLSPTIFVTFAIVFAIGYMVTKLVQGGLRNTLLPKTTIDQGGQNAIVSGVGYLGIFLAALIAITAAGINLSSLAIFAGALSVGIGFGLQNIVQNFVSGVILLIERPISEGDWVKVGTVEGHVRAISVRSTRIETFDRNFVVVPNGDLVTQQVTNYTRYNLSGRLSLPIGVAYGSDTRKVERILQEIAEAQPMVILNPPPFISFVGLGADSIDFLLLAVLRDVNSRGVVQKEILHQVVERFAAEGIEIPFVQRDVWLRNPDVLQEMVAPEKEPPPVQA